MQDKIKTWLYDIWVNIEEIQTFTGDRGYSLEVYKQDTKTKKAVERNLEIIGEAISRILTLNRSIAITDTRKIVDTRNRIIHGYEKVSQEIIWDIIQHSLPILKQEVENLLQEEEK